MSKIIELENTIILNSGVARFINWQGSYNVIAHRFIPDCFIRVYQPLSQSQSIYQRARHKSQTGECPSRSAFGHATDINIALIEYCSLDNSHTMYILSIETHNSVTALLE